MERDLSHVWKGVVVVTEEDKKKDVVEASALPAKSSSEMPTFGGVTIPEAAEALKQQQALIDLTEGLLKDTDYAYVVHKLDSGGKEQPQMFAHKEDAEKYAKAYESSAGKETKIERTKLKSAWLRLGLHLGVTVPKGQESMPVNKEVSMLGDNLICITTTGPGYKSVSIVALRKTPDGLIEGRILHEETTTALMWPATGRVAVRSGACSYTERSFAHKTHDVVAMSETRAFSRTMACLLGFGDTTAEEFGEGEVGEGAKPSPKQPMKKGGKKKDVAKSKEKEGDTSKESPPASNEEEPESRRDVVSAAAKLVGDDSDKVVDFYKAWKEKKHAADESFDLKIRMSKLSDELWQEFKADLNKWVGEESKRMEESAKKAK